MKWIRIKIFAALLFAIPASAQQRPLLTEDPRTLPMGTIATELGFGYSYRERFPVSGLEGDRYSLLANAVHIGVGPRAEFQMGGVAHTLLKVRENGTGWRNDWGDFFLSTKLMLLKEGAYHPVVSFRPLVILPNSNNDKGIGTDGTHFYGSMLFGKTLRRAFVFGTLGLGILDDAVRAAAQQDVLSYGIAVSIPATPRLSVLSEWNGIHNAQSNPSPGGESRGQLRLGVQWKAAGVRWDFGALAGTSRLDPDFGFVAGFTKEYHLP